jgi:hypothetical protein
MEAIGMLELVVDGAVPRKLNFEVRKLLLAGYTFRDQEQIKRHFEEVKKEGIAGPNSLPPFCPKLRDKITTDDRIEVLHGIKTSGEAEFVLLIDRGDLYIGIGSDHSDRETEKYNMWISKQICPCVLSKKVWLYQDIKDNWDNIIKRAWVEVDGKRQLYQETRLETFMRPEELLEKTKERVDGELDGTVVYAGTEATLGGTFIYSSYFEAELVDERSGRTLSCAYKIEPIDWFKGVIL